MKTFAIAAGCLLFSLQYISAQNTIGLPDVTNYPKSIYNAGMQNWEIAQDDNGLMYFGNTEGLLSFDGVSWKLTALPNKSAVRSVAIGKDKRIYVGGRGEFGFFTADANGHLSYTPLTKLIPGKNYQFYDVWDIVTAGEDVFFRTKQEIFHLSHGAIVVYPAATEWRFLGKSNNQVIAQDLRQGLKRFEKGSWRSFIGQSSLPEGFITAAILPIGKDSTLISSFSSGLFLLSNNQVTTIPLPASHPLLHELTLFSTYLGDDKIVVGTNQGCYIINKKGDLVGKLAKEEGLQNNTVLSLYLDKSKNLWVGLENGIDFVAYNNAIKHIYPQRLNEGLGYSSIIYKNELYLGTSIGLYKVPINNSSDLSSIRSDFQSIPHTQGSAWSLTEVKGQLLMGHHEGAYLINNQLATSLSKETGYWNFLPVPDIFDSSFVVAGSYTGLDFFQYDRNAFKQKGNLINFKEASRFLVVDNKKTIWVADIYRGVFRIDMNRPDRPNIKFYGKDSGLPSALRNHLFKIKDRVVVATEQGVYEFDHSADRFMPSSYFKTFFDKKNISFLKEDKDGNIWFVEDKSLGVVDFSGNSYSIIYFPELHGKLLATYPHVNPIDKNNILVGAEKGFYHIDFERYRKNNHNLSIGIRDVYVVGFDRNPLLGGSSHEIPSDSNSLHFDFSSPSFDRQASVTYSYRLQGFDKNWSTWTKKPEKEYTNLPPGEYSFQVKAKTNLGSESPTATYSFSILAPWYRTGLANVMYVLFGALLIYLFFQWQKYLLIRQQKKHEAEREHMQYVHQLELEKSEKEIIALRNQQLTSEIGSKNSELASIAMHLVQKGEVLGKIKEELSRLEKEQGFDHTHKEFKKINRIFNVENQLDNEWEVFASHFNTVNGDFLKALREIHPNLSPTEMKLAAYLRINLSSKEMAKLMNITVRAVEVGRYRLRKKLQIPTEITFYNFFSDISSAKTV